jgi:similar to stage IV sporulation protein
VTTACIKPQDIRDLRSKGTCAVQFAHLHKLGGYARIEIRGKRHEQLINLMIAKGMQPWDLVKTGDGKMEMNLPVSHVLRLRPLLKQTGCRFHTLQRHGLPFFVKRVGKRKFFAAGLLVFVVGIYLLSQVVWSVSVDGVDKLSRDQVLQAARQEGIFPMQWKFRLGDPNQLSRQLHGLLPGTAWVGVEIHGTQVRIKVVESRSPDQRQLMNPRNLIASKNAVVTEIFASKGRPLVQPNSYVRKGDVLISGIVGNEQNQQIVVADGKVKGLVWYTANIESPLIRRTQTYTGRTKNRFYLVIGNRGLQLTGYGKLPFTDYATIPDRYTLHWKRWSLPVGWLTEKLMEVNVQEQPIDPKQAAAQGLEQAKADLLNEAGKDAVVKDEKILHEKQENGKIYIEAHIEIEQYIEMEQPIIQGE